MPRQLEVASVAVGLASPRPQNGIVDTASLVAGGGAGLRAEGAFYGRQRQVGGVGVQGDFALLEAKLERVVPEL